MVAQSYYKEDTRAWTLRLRNGMSWRTVLKIDAPIDTPEIEGFAPDGQSLLFSRPSGTGWNTDAVSLSSGADSPSSVDIEGFAHLLFAPQSQRIIGGEHIGERFSYEFFSPQDQKRWTRSQRSLQMIPCGSFHRAMIGASSSCK